jgi:hypothetical protein
MKFPGNYLNSIGRSLFAGLAMLSIAAVAQATGKAFAPPLAPGVQVHAWTILSDSMEGDMEVIAAAKGYGINSLGFSQKLMSRLSDLANPEKLQKVQRLTKAARAAGIPEIVVWENPIYWVDYYPEKFRTGPEGTIDLDNPEFWAWFKADYNRMLDLLPDVNALHIQFMESQGQIVSQYSKKYTTEPEKLALLVRMIHDVVVKERGMNLYARIYPNDRPDNPHIPAMVALFPPDVRLTIKVTPIDYLLTVPDCGFIGALKQPTVVEFVPAAEFAGQGVVANTWVEDTVARWQRLSKMPNVIGYSARTDRFMESRLIGQPGEICLLALQRVSDNPNVTADEVYDEFITKKYGKKALPHVKAAFKNSWDFATSTFYTLGTVLGDHSMLNFDYTPPYVEMASGRWFNPPVMTIGHGVNKEFHTWRDVMNRLAPPFVKDPAYKLDTVRNNELRAGAVGLPADSNQAKAKESRYLPTDAMAMRHFLIPGEAMDEEYLNYIRTEKNHAVAVMQDSVKHIEQAKGDLSKENYEQLYHYFNRSLLTARLWRATTSSYFGFRVWSRGSEFQTPGVTEMVQDGLTEMKAVSKLIRKYPVKPVAAQYNWLTEPDNADRYFRYIVQTGWPRESQPGIPNPNAGMKFPYREAK